MWQSVSKLNADRISIKYPGRDPGVTIAIGSGPRMRIDEIIRWRSGVFCLGAEEGGRSGISKREAGLGRSRGSSGVWGGGRQLARAKSGGRHGHGRALDLHLHQNCRALMPREHLNRGGRRLWAGCAAADMSGVIRRSDPDWPGLIGCGAGTWNASLESHFSRDGTSGVSPQDKKNR